MRRELKITIDIEDETNSEVKDLLYSIINLCNDRVMHVPKAEIGDNEVFNMSGICGELRGV